MQMEPKYWNYVKIGIIILILLCLLYMYFFGKRKEESLTIPNNTFDESKSIYIKNDNWSATDLPWIQNHTGSWSDPHIIENVTINGQNSRSCILIEDSNDCFILKNCTVYNAPVGLFGEQKNRRSGGLL